jgi:hypothetical protein
LESDNSQTRSELEEERAAVRAQIVELERELRLYRKLHFSTELIHDRIRPLKHREEQLALALDRAKPEGAPGTRQWASVQRNPSPSK